MFGTFQEERDGEEIVYGLVDPVHSFNPFYLQVRFKTETHYDLFLYISMFLNF